MLARAGAHGRTASAAIVIGEAGSGKSSLLGEAVRHWGEGRVAAATGFEPMQSIPLAAMGEVLRALSAAPATGAHLEELLFGGATAATAATAAPRGSDPLRIFEAAHRALAELGAMLLLVDDLQWLDEQSLALLHYLLRAAASQGRPLAVIAAARPSTGALAFRDAVRALLPAEHTAAVELGALPLDDAVSLVRAIDRDLDERTAAEMWRVAQGSPFWLEALARRHGGESTASLIEDRLRALSREASELLAVLAVAARPLPVQDIAAGLSRQPERTAFAARELTIHGLAGESAEGIRTAHDLIRDEVVRLLPAGARRRTHGTLAQLLESTAGEDARQLVEALEHRVAAGVPAADLVARIVAAPNRRVLGAANLRLLAEVSDAVPATPPLLDLDAGIAALAAAVGAQELALDRWERTSRVSEDAALRLQAEIGAARAATALTRREQAHAHIDRARTAGAQLSRHVTMELDAMEAQVELWLDHRTADGRERAERALQAARSMAADAGGLQRLDTEARRAYLVALHAVSDAALQEDRCQDMAALADEAIEVARGLGDEAHVAALLRSALGQRHLLRMRDAEQRFRSALELARRLVLPTQAVEAGHGLCQTLRDLGRLEEAHRVGAEAGELESRLRIASRHWQGARTVLHVVELYLGDTDAALRALHQDALDQPDPHFRLAIHQCMASWQARYLGVRAQPEVEAQVEAALRCAELSNCPRCTVELLLVSAESLAHAGNPSRARALLGRAPGGGGDNPLRRSWEARARAAVALAEGRAQDAADMFAALAHDLEQHGLLLELVWAQVSHARALARSDRRAAVQRLTAAAAVAERAQSQSQARVVARELRRLGVRAWRRGAATLTGDVPGALAALSVREKEIVEHLAQGRSNAEIADALLVSPKTVERHVSNVLAKLGLRNRTEVAAAVRSAGAGTGFPR